MMPSPVGDDAIAYRCHSCFTEVVFESCGGCGFRQSIPSRWHTAYTCGKCGAPNRIQAEKGATRVKFACKQCGHKQETL